MKTRSRPPLLVRRDYSAPSVFKPENLLREGRRQLRRRSGRVPSVCLLDPDGDIARHLIAAGEARLNPSWACYHTNLYDTKAAGGTIGIVPFAVGASFAVLVAEELFASGCRLLISITSAGQIDSRLQPPVFLLIEKALRDEGTSYHYLPPSDFACLEPRLRARLTDLLGARTARAPRVMPGATWTTDAPFRETAQAIARARRLGVHAVEMEAAALYALAAARRRPVVCFALITNRMGRKKGDFEKGSNRGIDDALALVGDVRRALVPRERTRAGA